MDDHQQNPEKHRGDYKPRYFRNNRGANYTNKPQRNYFYSDASGASPSVVETDNTSGEYYKDYNSVYEPPRNVYNFPAEYNGNSKHSRGNYGSTTRHLSYSQSEYVPRTNKPRNENAHRNPSTQNFSSYQQSSTDPEPTGVQRGKIIGGRYIRKHLNQSIAHSSSENPVTEENLNGSSHSNSHRSKSSSDNPKGRVFSLGANQRKNFPKKLASSDDYSGRSSFQSSSKKSEENTYASSDVYHYPSQTVSDHKSFKSPREFHPKSPLSTMSSYHENKATQRELLIQHLNKGDCECLVCCEQIRVKDQTWHCLSCYHVFHLRCIRKWARSPAALVDEGGWRCPACQSLSTKVPYDYLCFCGKHKNPDVNYHLTPHSCGDICGRKRPDCSHLCKELCHPGPCPSCSVVVQKSCPCGKTFKTTTCKLTVEETCNSVCDKILNCGVHTCKNKCHSGECSACEETIVQNCYCGKSTQTVVCTPVTASILRYSCGTVCSLQLNCGHHTCESICHPDVCLPCSLSVEVVQSCSCGKSSIDKLISAGKATKRTSCKDPIPLCGEKCERILPCGPKGNPHKCESLCHEGDCPKCPLATLMKCRCGAFTKDFSCADITASFVFLCEKRCNRRKNCGRHKCLSNCCINIEHRCELVCNKRLTCGSHQCQELCHMGNCPTCWNVSFDELRCHCGEAVLYPPIHCGTKPPECSNPCTRTHTCDHEVRHTCHSDESCPPCTYLTAKWCYGHHKQCGSVMCFLDGVSCGMPCNKELLCQKHKCKLTCHTGPCLKDDGKCTQPCSVPRTTCGHPCGNPCHTGPCPESACKAQVTLVCPCGHRSETTTCHDSTKSYRLMSVSVLASKMQEIKEGMSVNLNDVLGQKSKNSKLQCNEECAVLERNKRLAVALQIQNPELSTSPGPPSYSEFLKNEAKKSPIFVADVYDRISDLVQLAKESKQKCRSHSFPAMNRDQRRVVHELAEFFGCETQSYDEEPKKNVVVTAHKSKCWLPFVNIMTVVQRDMGFRKGPTPVLAQREMKNVPSSLNNQKKKVDYFDYNE